MIIQELYNYYNRLAENEESGIPERFLSIEKVAWEFKINADGKLLSITPFSQGEGKGAKSFVEMKVPEHDVRSSGIKPFFLCDKAAYLVGLDEKRGSELFAASKKLHVEVLDSTDDGTARAILNFFDCLQDNQGLINEQSEALLKGGFAVFLLSSEQSYAHEQPALINAWQKHCNATTVGTEGQCSITGKKATLARLFPTTSGVMGAQSSGASLVSFNLDAFESYGKKQAYNASLSEEVAFKAGAALKYVLSHKSHTCRIGDTTIVFWADRPAVKESALVAQFFDGRFASSQNVEDSLAVKAIKAAFDDIKKGVRPAGYNHETQFFILGLAPNAARLAVRFFWVSSFGQLEDNFGIYLRDIEMEGVRAVSLYSYLAQVAPLGKLSDIPSTLISSSVQAMLTKKAFPQSLYALLLSRMRCDHASKNTWDMGQRAAMMKACLLRRARIIKGESKNYERGITVALNEENTHSGYLLGRLFAVLEKAQRDAIPGINATISDRYIGAAATSPARVYPNLMRMAQAHISTLRKRGKGFYLDRLMTEVVSKINSDNPYPKALSTEEQGLFYIGYYQQKEALWKKKTNENNAEGTGENNQSDEAEL